MIMNCAGRLEVGGRGSDVNRVVEWRTSRHVFFSPAMHELKEFDHGTAGSFSS
jgi:hypothetical protein